VEGDSDDDREEHAVGRRPQAGVPDILNRDRDNAADGAGAYPEDRRSIRGEGFGHQHRASDQGN
jgi:hypothetical protein